MRLMIMIAAVAVVGVPISADAGDWRVVYVDTQTASAVDVGGIRTVAGKKVAWSATIFSTTQEEDVDYHLVRREYDCAASLWTGLSLTQYNASGANIYSSHERRPTLAVIPDSVGEHLFNAVCFGEGVSDESYSRPSDVLTKYREFLTD